VVWGYEREISEYGKVGVFVACSSLTYIGTINMNEKKGDGQCLILDIVL
jgi:hypothetical protein